MAEKLFLEVVTPERAVVSEEVEIVVAPGSEGEFGVLKGHTTFLTSLDSGILRFKTASRIFSAKNFAFSNPTLGKTTANSSPP